MAYNKYYANGWQNNEEGETPITAAALNHMEDGIVELDGNIGDKLDTSKVANNLTTTDAGYVLDARQGKSLKTAVDAKSTIKFVTKSLGSIAINAQGAAEKTADVSSSIPSGYTLRGAYCTKTGGYGVYCYSCAATGTSITIQLFRASGSATTTTPEVMLICTK